MSTIGSKWRKWNFHVHTKGTNKNDQFSSPTIDEFFFKFFKKAYDKKIYAIGITDYFSIERYLEAVEYKNNIQNKIGTDGISLFDDDEIVFIKGMFIFPNVELRMLPSTGRSKLINIHCLFNPEYVPDLDNDFFSYLKNQDGKMMNRYGITDYGKFLDSSITESHKQYQKGIDNFALDVKSIKELISKNKKFRDNTLLVVSNSNSDGASGTQMHYDLFENEGGSLDGVRKTIYEMSNAIFSANPKDIKYFAGRKSEGQDNYNEELYKKEVDLVIKERGSLKPCLVGCDAHREEDLFTKFTWVKADLHFEGLRQICFEPEQRVRIQEDEPDFKEEKLLIDNVSFISPNNIFSTIPIHLNPNLNVIIGGKSSGKSILLYAIAKTLSADDRVLRNDDDSYRYDLDKIEEEFDFKITTKGGFSQKLKRPDDENSILPEIKYIPQNYLVKLAEPELNKKGKTLNKLVRDLITEDKESRELYQNFVNTVSNNDKLRNGEIDNYFEIQREIVRLENDLKTKSNKEVLEKNIQTNSGKVEDLTKNSGLTPEQVQKYNDLRDKLDLNNSKKQDFKEDLHDIQVFNREFIQMLTTLKEKKDLIVDQLRLQEIKDYYKNLYGDIDSLLEKAISIKELTETEVNEEGLNTFKNNCKFEDVLISLSDEKSELSQSIQPYLQDAETKKIIEELNLSISDDKRALQDIISLNRSIGDQKIALQNSKNKIFQIYEDSYKEYLNIISNLKNRTIELQNDGLTIVGKAKFNYVKLRNGLYNISDGRSASYNQFPILSRDKKAIDDADFQTIVEQIKMLFDDLVNNVYALNSRTSVIEAFKLILDDYFFDYWEITYKNDKLGEMSTGKASFVILMLIIGLSKSKAPILIDQPEDNLDNRSITTDLVNYLRNKKIERQIIIVTHNANIVVNADAENVIIANQKGQSDEASTSAFRFDYINGAIENSFEKLKDQTDLLKSMGIRQHIADIVEGGKDAFIKRERRYRFR
ncbi:TrlF family AAA-like ATPase [Elizabethkingia anophelis]|uniref:ATPase involved in DNA repair n=1 Tax=Elizabethkingia anophelis TaxID=1117645 RepID=A0A455ZEU2_9FLAO|nr:hypothetical protein [Elizabethkingia anophelis]AKH95194.1 hypothetical protein M876_11515 [Elizabethkingia anophelis FMS-007]DAC75280.1 TPA_exp: ATPase involved in DNA repair [Elizabethkingia anophelis]